MKVIRFNLWRALLAGLFCVSTLAGAQTSDLVINGQLTQGSLLRGQLPRGAEVTLDGNALVVNRQGKFVFGFERDAELTHTLKWTLADGSKGEYAFSLLPRDYNVQRIDGLAQDMVSPPKAVLERIRNDSAKVARARSGVRNYDAVFTRFSWPAQGPITGVYGSQRILNGEPKRPHFGVDIGGPIGTPVVAPADGIVVLADDLYYSGNTLILDHGMGVYSTFLHMDSITVKPGQTLSKGELMGTIGETGRATGPHLDWRINLGPMRLDPALLVSESSTPETSE